ncbi:MAG: energy-coupling factor transporter transmembrane protein EcfT [Candidatus Methanomethylicota archaeon]|uniref:Energy-coupling factor transporter transmembrane protein EcfT n=1 Tax=Thermoproteota archaeon TaxID=2056631 RepID=A0A520KGK1_9CREN|nr:MAG: energy-coupling factor transporter transmembrane protein EcfT [Candidatus Verstraetearchaeota archaeon]TDA39649.1 MAG: energy-coupling factor transporter transmembrane protein EcfT [Candidatus Verstraetearchaeota archaeon]
MNLNNIFSNISLDPRTKIIVFLGLFCLTFTVKDLYCFPFLTIITAIIVLLGRNMKIFLKMLIKFIPILLIAFILWSIFYSWSLFYRSSSTTINLDIGIFMTLRLLTIISISLAFILVVKPEELIKALELFRLPYALAFTLGLALRHINNMSDEYRAIKEARISRGLELDHGSLLKRIKNYTYVLIPLLIRAMETAEKITLAMELKAFNLRKTKHKLDYRLNTIDYLIITIMIITIGISIVYYNFRGVLL